LKRSSQEKKAEEEDWQCKHFKSCPSTILRKILHPSKKKSLKKASQDNEVVQYRAFAVF